MIIQGIEIRTKHVTLIRRFACGDCTVSSTEWIELTELYKIGFVAMSKADNGQARIDGLTSEGSEFFRRLKSLHADSTAPQAFEPPGQSRPAEPFPPATDHPPTIPTATGPRGPMKSLYDVTLAGPGSAPEQVRVTDSECKLLADKGYTISSRVKALDGRDTFSEACEVLSRLYRHAELTGKEHLQLKAAGAIRALLAEQRFLSGETEVGPVGPRVPGANPGAGRR